MGPPPPRPPAQFGMGSMGPPPPRTVRPQGISVVKRVLFCMPRVVAKYILSTFYAELMCMQEGKMQSFHACEICAAAAAHEVLNVL